MVEIYIMNRNSRTWVSSILTLDFIRTMANKKYQLHDDISSVAGIGSRLKNLLNSIGIHDILDLLFYFPRDYKDYRDIRKIADIATGDEVTLKGEIILSGLLRTRKRIYEVVITDGAVSYTHLTLPTIYSE